jgi:hypothetical protein
MSRGEEIAVFAYIAMTALEVEAYTLVFPMVTMQSKLSARQFMHGEPPSETSHLTFLARQLWQAAGARLRAGFGFSTRFFESLCVCASFGFDEGLTRDCILVILCSRKFIKLKLDVKAESINGST